MAVGKREVSGELDRERESRQGESGVEKIFGCITMRVMNECLE